MKTKFKIGDTVTMYNEGFEIDQISIIKNAETKYTSKDIKVWFFESQLTLVKAAPVYEYQYLYKSNYCAHAAISGFYKSKNHFLAGCNGHQESDFDFIKRIVETKKEIV